MNANATTETPAAAPEITTIETPAKKPAARKGAAKKNAKKPAAKNQSKPAAKRTAKAAVPKPGSKAAAAPREGSKGSQILGLLQRKSGATLPELMAATKWQRHSVRGFLSTARKRVGIKIEATREGGITTYRIA